MLLGLTSVAAIAFLLWLLFALAAMLSLPLPHWVPGCSVQRSFPMCQTVATEMSLRTFSSLACDGTFYCGCRWSGRTKLGFKIGIGGDRCRNGEKNFALILSMISIA